MLKHVSELVVRIADLAEAEGRVARRAIGRLGIGFAFSLLAAGLLLGGALLVLAGTWIGLAGVIGPVWASVIVGAVGLAAGFGVLKIAEGYHK